MDFKKALTLQLEKTADTLVAWAGATTDEAGLMIIAAAVKHLITDHFPAYGLPGAELTLNRVHTAISAQRERILSGKLPSAAAVAEAHAEAKTTAEIARSRRRQIEVLQGRCTGYEARLANQAELIGNLEQQLQDRDRQIAQLEQNIRLITATPDVQS